MRLAVLVCASLVSSFRSGSFSASCCRCRGLCSIGLSIFSCSLACCGFSGVTGISRRDPCLHFARVLSGCAAGERREVDGPRAKELVRTAHTSVKDLAPVLGDLGTRVKFEISEDAAGFGLNPLPTTGCRVLAPGIANLTCANVMTLHIEGMTLIDPVINHMLLSNLNRALRASVARRRMPQENEQLQALVTLLVMGSKVRQPATPHPPYLHVQERERERQRQRQERQRARARETERWRSRGICSC